jgi:hypothetical protein
VDEFVGVAQSFPTVYFRLDAARWSDEHPVANVIILGGVILLVAGLIVFAKPVERFLDRANLRLLHVLGLADKDRDKND